MGPVAWLPTATSERVPNDAALEADLLDMAELLRLVYRAEARSPVPGDPAPEVVEAERAAQELAGRRVPGRTGFDRTPSSAKHLNYG
jgi:hypothetical protein